MPRATGSKAGAILAFFKSAHLEVAEMVLGMAKDAINGRKALADKVRAGQVKAAKAEAKEVAAKPRRTRGPNKPKVAAAVEAPKPRRKRAPRTRKLAAAIEPELPMQDADDSVGVEAEAELAEV